MAKGHLHQVESWMSRWWNNVNQGIQGRNKVSSGQLTQCPMPASGNPKDVAAQMEAKVEVAEVPEDETEPATPNTRQQLFPADDRGREDDNDERRPLQDNGGERKDAKKKPKGKQAKGRTTRRSPSPMDEAGSGDDDNSSRSSCSASPRHKSRTPSPRKSPRKTVKPVRHGVDDGDKGDKDERKRRRREELLGPQGSTPTAEQQRKRLGVRRGRGKD
uniref:Uncharacterized protein n=1 Tax=Eutreptiella gymnastica TaxID=73025 RepID=A0A7S1I8Y5_9EUGL|mmetsp:Transcript_13976/g.24922  ORF Transcript_13976/g.24922 Transcript_13976/m.24922 type:complete len:217 (+) Transcript_13976:401-1051(+)